MKSQFALNGQLSKIDEEPEFINKSGLLQEFHDVFEFNKMN